MPSTFLDGVARIRRLIAAGTDIGVGNCKLRTREAFSVPSNGTRTAALSWVHAPDQHRDTNPASAPAYSFGWMTGGGEGAGHVVVVLPRGRILTPGGPAAPGRWYETTAADLLRAWPNLQWVGWTRSIDGQYPALPAPAKADPKPNAKPRRRGPVTRSRALLQRALERAEAQRNDARAKAIRAALRRLRGLGQ